ncbi:hypothetical protein BDN72DRAFT_577759 [Pluteus cervinus]|uniref:Uncharacterized protein n=1 Tax=Pluteus cervinus TaxID=181527 RepID=A0ACD3A4M0_9AGAR|nr:hypothetical protein BDN72DRAFT_577759 [Pluteus cervinus]
MDGRTMSQSSNPNNAVNIRGTRNSVQAMTKNSLTLNSNDRYYTRPTYNGPYVQHNGTGDLHFVYPDARHDRTPAGTGGVNIPPRQTISYENLQGPVPLTSQPHPSFAQNPHFASPPIHPHAGYPYPHNQFMPYQDHNPYAFRGQGSYYPPAVHDPRVYGGPFPPPTYPQYPHYQQPPAPQHVHEQGPSAGTKLEHGVPPSPSDGQGEDTVLTGVPAEMDWDGCNAVPDTPVDDHPSPCKRCKCKCVATSSGHPGGARGQYE